jgi:hypothetical protein
MTPKQFRGQEFERHWGGSQGYDRPDPGADENWVDRLIVPSLTFLSPTKFQERGYWTRYVPFVAALPWALVALGLIVGGTLALPSKTVSSHRFVPSLAQRNVRSGTSHVTDCFDVYRIPPQDNGPDATVTNADANQALTVYRHNVVAVVVSGEQGLPLISAHSPFCFLDSLASTGIGPGSYTVSDYYAEKPGTATFTFIESANQTAVVEVAVTKASPPSSVPLLVLILGIAFALCFTVIVVRHLAGRRKAIAPTN